MHTFVIREIVSGVLLPLPQLVARLGLADVASWGFRDVRLQYGQPFGLAMQEFERMSRDTPGGYRVSADAFRDFLHTEFQIIDGEIEARDKDEVCILHLDCFDGSEWELRTASDQLAADLESRGFRQADSQM